MVYTTLNIQGLPQLGAFLRQLDQPDNGTGFGTAGRKITLTSECAGKLPVIFHPGLVSTGGNNLRGGLSIFDGCEDACSVGQIGQLCT
jgi:hypothetical protein